MKKRNILRKIALCVLSFVMIFTSLSTFGCKESPSNNDKKEQGNIDIKFAYAEDKFLQNYEGTSALQAQGQKFSKYYIDSFSISAFRNEYESRQIVLTPETDVGSFNVVVGDFMCGESKLSSQAFEVGYVYYHNVKNIIDTKTDMQPGMYPDAILPMKTAKEYGLNTIKAKNNQAVLITVCVPKEQPVGVYNGEISIDIDGTIQKVNATVEVLDYTLPSEVTVRSCWPIDSEALAYFELDESQEMYDKLVDSLKNFRQSAYFLDRVKEGVYDEGARQVLADAHVSKMLQAYFDEKVPCYSVPTNGKADSTYVTILDTDLLRTYLKTMVDKSIEENVDLFKKAYVYMGSIIDEPEAWAGVGDKTALGRVDYVCNQYNVLLAEIADYADSLGGSTELHNHIINLPHVVTASINGDFDLVQTYCPEPQYYDSSATIEDYQALRNDNKDYWWYTCTNPKYPYPQLHIDANGVSARVMYWMMKEYDITGYLTWEVLKAYDDYGNPPRYNSGMELYEDVQRTSGAIGDGFYYYPGKLFGLDRPVPAIRLYYVRDGAEDYDAINDLEDNYYKALSNKYESKLSISGIMNEVYSSLYNINKVYCTSQELQDAKNDLNTLAVWASHGIAISDYKLNSNGNVTANIFAPSQVVIKLNGKVLNGIDSGEGKKYVINSQFDNFNLEIEGRTLTFTAKQKMATTITKNSFVFQDNEQQDMSGISVTDNTAYGVNTTRINATSDVKYILLNIDENVVTKSCDSLILYVYVDCEENVRTELLLYGSVMRTLDTVYLKKGYNEIRIDRLGDLDWTKIKKAKQLIFNFDKPSNITIDFEALTVK